jgi:hypothetical protein
MVVWNILRPGGIFYGHFVIWLIFPVLVNCITKNLATLIHKMTPGLYIQEKL